MGNVKVAEELMVIAKCLLAMNDNYKVIEDVVDELSKVKGIASAGASDGFNDETTFTISLELVVTSHEFGRVEYPSEFMMPLRKLKGAVKRALSNVGGDLKPVLDGKIDVPRKKTWVDEFGNRKSAYEHNRVYFNVRVK